jgi:beta-glucanase (GH16 family)
MTNFTKVLDDNFGSDTSLKTSLWPIHWGNPDDFSFQNGALTLTSYKSEGWKNVGFMQADFGASSGTGYGLYSVTASANAGEGIGIAILLWPSSNVWPGPELDVLESRDSTRQTGYATIHWKGTNGADQQSWHQFSIDLTKPHTYALDWEPTSITYFIDGQQIFTTTSHVPKDFADGGQNESFGAEVTAAGSSPVSSSVSLHLYDMSYSKPEADPTITDINAQVASLPAITSGSQVFSAASTGLAAPVTESVSGGVVTVSTPAGGLDKVIELTDAEGGSYQVQNFLDGTPA